MENSSWWLGATDEATEGTFRWLYPDIDGAFNFSFPFAPDEPDNEGMYGGDCLQLVNIGGNLFLKDNDCLLKNSSTFVCEENPLKKVKFRY